MSVPDLAPDDDDDDTSLNLVIDKDRDKHPTLDKPDLYLSKLSQRQRQKFNFR